MASDISREVFWNFIFRNLANEKRSQTELVVPRCERDVKIWIDADDFVVTNKYKPTFFSWVSQ